MRTRLHSIRCRLIIVFVIPMLGMAILSASIYNIAANAIIGNFESAYAQSLEKTADYFKLAFDGIQNKAIELINNKDLQRYYNGQYKNNNIEELKIYNDIKNSITTFVAADMFINNVYVFADYGKDISTIGNTSGTYANYVKNQEALWDGNAPFMWSGYHSVLDDALALDKEDYGLSITYRMKNKKGYVVIDIKREIIQDTMNGIDAGENAIAGLLSYDNREILSKTDRENYFTSLSIYEKIVSGELKEGSEYININNQNMLVLYKTIEGTDSAIFLAIPKKDILAKIDAVKGLAVVLTVIFSLVAGLFGMLIAMDVTKALEKIMKVMGKAAKGNLAVRIKSKRKDEFGVLNQSFTDMLSNICFLIQKVDESNTLVSMSVSEVEGNSDVLLMNSRHIVESTTEIKKCVENQIEDIQNGMNQMSELSNKIDTISGEVSQINMVIQDTGKQTEKGRIAISELNDNTGRTHDNTKAVIQSIVELSEMVTIIYGIVDMISSVAEQTNLLSLNASIEAARAGESGKGFSVVAMEIGKLAKQSSDAVDKIQNIITNIQHKIDEMVDTADCVDRNLKVQSQSLEETMVVFSEINNYINKLELSVANIVHESKVIGGLKEQTVDSLENFSASTEENSAASDTIGIVVEEQLKSVEEIATNIKLLLDNQIVLNEYLQKFTISEEESSKNETEPKMGQKNKKEMLLKRVSRVFKQKDQNYSSIKGMEHGEKK